MEKSFRVHTNITGDTLLNVNMQQDFDFLEILSLKLRQKDAYRLHSSNYGVIVGRVLANDAFGIPNAKVSVFIERDSSDSNEMRNIYPYSEVMSRDSKSRRYNLLPDYSNDSCYRVVGTFPRKRYLLDDDMQLDVYDKYWKYTTVTNKAGDYMIFGVPEGSQQIHVDIDLSDIGILSQRPRDFVFKGYDLNEFDTPSQFKESTNLDGLVQIISQNKTTVVYPFWGDATNGVAAITRCDVQVNYKFEPTCVFMGSIISDNDGNSIGHRCAPDIDCGLNSQLVAGEGRIEMIRKTTDGLVEEFPIKGNVLIDSDGVWCYQIPMNLDYIGTDEYGNIVATDNPSKGIPTRTQVRFRISKTETGEEGFSRHTAKYLVPMNPVLDEDEEIPTTQEETGIKMETMYNFGSNTPISCFRDLYWNNVYSVKNYIPKVQVAHRPYSKNYGGLKGANLVDNQNPIPFNKLRIDMPFSYMIVCILFTVVMYIVSIINWVIKMLMNIRNLCLTIGWWDICPFKWVLPKMGCIPLNAGLGDNDDIAYYPGCGCPGSYACDYSECPKEMDGVCNKQSDNEKLLDKIQQALAEDYKIIKLDFYQDWLNGALYMPLWFWRKRKKITFLFFTLSGAKNEFCSCEKRYSRLKTYVTCNLTYHSNSFETDSSVNEGERWHKTATEQFRYKNGLIKPVENKDGLTAYYYVGYQATTDDPIDTDIMNRVRPFQVAKLYATDIILLGNLNEDNLYGIPQFFKVLPSTTANIPPIATIQENVNERDVETFKEGDLDTISLNEDSGSTVTTGMDWGHDGGKQVPTYKNGLFMDLACTYAGTRSKSCINAERLSELGVNLDSTYDMSFAQSSSGLKSGKIDSDGFINKLELDDLDNRATFATLNHIGFIPQEYQDSIDGYETQVKDVNTGYLVPKFKYVYPVDFDGRMKYQMRAYRKSFNQGLYDEIDEAYITFRMGAEKDKNKDNNLEQRVRHFYKHNGGFYSMPLFNNSFYFYFGINKGNTAIDKFNKLFYAECFQRNKDPFSFNIEARGKAYCTSTYKDSSGQLLKYAYNGYAYIRFTSDDIITPYSYTLYDSVGNVVVPTETGMTVTDFVIGGIIEEKEEGGKRKKVIKMNDEGHIKYQQADEDTGEYYDVPTKYSNGLTNQTYTLEIIDDNGKKKSERIELNVPKITISYDTTSLGARFYTTATTRMDYICNDNNELYGMIRLLSFNVDGYEYYITEATPLSYDADLDAYVILIRGVSGEIDDNAQQETDKFKKLYDASAIVKVSAVNTNEVGWIRDCMCDVENRIFDVNGQESFIDNTLTEYWFGIREPLDDEAIPGLTGKQVIPTFFVYQPNRFNITIAQLCEVDGVEVELEDNVTSEIATVLNGDNFNVFLNDMPVKFMLGTNTDNIEAVVSNKSKFYYSEAVTNPKNVNISGWYGVHQEDSYRWDMSENMVLARNEDMWKDFVDFQNEIKHHLSKVKILRFKFDTMFSLSNGVYVVDRAPTLTYMAVGGNKKLLYRDVAPDYVDSATFKSTYRLADENTVTVNRNYPNIVANNYSGYTSDDYRDGGPFFNKAYGERNGAMQYIGNYFAVFTNNGGYTSKTEVDSSAKVMKMPNYAKVTPWNRPNEKKLGSDEYGTIHQFTPAHTKQSSPKTLPYLRGMFVDRRLDHDLIVFAPSSSQGNVLLYPKERRSEQPDYVPDPSRPACDDVLIPSILERLWQNARISGVTYNGIEMSYDKDYNIISADTITYYYVPEVDMERKFSVYEDAVQYAFENIEGITEENAGKYVVEVGEVTATRNKRLEYSYNFSDDEEDAKTYYNSEENMIWEEDAYDVVDYDEEGNKYVVKEGDKNGQILKRFYEASFTGSDVRNMFWSNFNKKRLSKYVEEQRIGVAGYDTNAKKCAATYNYVFKYPYDNTRLYNGDFNRSSVINTGNYPTKRYIDVCNIPTGSSYKLDIKNCTYNTKTRFNKDNTITCEVDEGDGISITTTFGSPITFVSADSSNKTYANAMYRKEKGKYDSEDPHYTGYTMFKNSNIMMAFSINPTSDKNGDFNIYAGSPKLIRVLPYLTVDGVSLDGISAIKTASLSKEVFAGVSNIYDIIDSLAFYVYQWPSDDDWTNMSNGNDTFVTTNIWRTNMPLKNGGKTHNFYFFQDGTSPWRFITCDSQEFQSTVFRCPILGYEPQWETFYRLNQNSFALAKTGGLKMFTVLVEKTYVSKEDDNLTKGLLTFEFSDIYDVREIYLRVNNIFNKENKPYTYIQKVSVSSTHKETNTTDTSYDEQGQETGSEEVRESSDEENFTHVQVMTFDMFFPGLNDPMKGACEAFANTDMMSFYFTFTTSNGDAYVLEPFETKVLLQKYNEEACDWYDEDEDELDYLPIGNNKNDKIVLLKVRWTQEMGVIADRQWDGGVKCEFAAKTREGFTYKIQEFYLKFNGIDGASYDKESKTSDMEVDKPYRLNIEIP